MLNTPVVFLIFNRPHTTARVFEAIRAAQPRRLLIVADGARDGREGEADLVAQTRAIVERIDWNCDVQRLYADANLGCKRRVSSGLDWAFAQCEEAIVLEDDCLPHPAFFRFCEELLVRYRDDERIMGIGGTNYQYGQPRGDDSYYFSRFTHIWGWASWRRSWQLVDVELKLWDEIRAGNWLSYYLYDDRLAAHWGKMFDAVRNGTLDTWDCQWAFASWIHSKLGIVPNVNLISNIGFGADATHTRSRDGMANLPTRAMQFPLQHPQHVIRNTLADRFTDIVQGGITPTPRERIERAARQRLYRMQS
jgi:hypothetical protein